MAKVKTEEKNLEDIAQAIVNKTHKAGCFLPSEMAAAIDNIVTLKEGTADGNATANEILNSKTAYVKGKKVVGEMPDQTGVSKVIKPSESFTIPKGYHDGTGEVTVDSSGSAAADSILSGKTAWVNGEQITGEMPNQGAQIKEINPNQPYTIPQGYHNGEGMVTVNAPGSATSNNVLSGKTAWVGKTQITGTMPNNSATNVTLHLINPSVSIPAGYNPAGKVNIILEEKNSTPSEEEQTIRPSSGKVLSKVIVNPIPSKYQDVSGVTAVAGDVLTGKKYVNSAGQVINGAMPNIGAETVTITPDQTHAISKGYHNGNGEISVSTPATAIAENILLNKTVWINNKKVTGTMPDQSGSVTKPIKPNESFPILKGYYGGNGIVTVNSYGTAEALNILSGKTAWVNSEEVTGTMPNNPKIRVKLDTSNKSQAIPMGYSPAGGSVSIDLETKLVQATRIEQKITPTPGKVISEVIVAPIPEGYYNVSSVTAKAEDVSVGRKYVDSTGQVINGTMADGDIIKFDGFPHATGSPIDLTEMSDNRLNTFDDVNFFDEKAPQYATIPLNGDSSVKYETSGKSARIYSVEGGGVFAPQDCTDMFFQFSAKTLNLSSLDTSNTTNMREMFGYSQTKSLDLSSFNTSKATDMQDMFNTSQATSLDLSNFNTSNVKYMQGMFAFSEVNRLNLSNFNTSNVTNMYQMFRNSKAVLLDLSSFDTSNVTNMSQMFQGSLPNELDLSSFNTSKVENMSSMFLDCFAVTLDLSSFDTSNVTNTTDMFKWSQAKTVYCRTEADKQKFATSSNCPATINFIVGKPTA